MQNIRKTLKKIRSNAQRVYEDVYSNNQDLDYPARLAECGRDSFVERECLKLGFSGVNFDRLNNVLLHSDYTDKFSNARLSDLSETATETGCALPVIRLLTYNVNEIAPEGYTEKSFLFGFENSQKLEGCVFVNEILVGTIDWVRDVKLFICHCGESIFSGTLEEIRLKLRIRDIKSFLTQKNEF